MKVVYKFIIILTLILSLTVWSKEDPVKKFDIPENISKEGIHQKVDELMLNDRFVEAEALAKATYEKYPYEPEVICALACVYRNKSYKSGISMEPSLLGIKDGHSGKGDLKGKDIKEIFKEEIYFDEELHSKAESLYYKIIRIEPTYHNAYFNLLNDYATIADFNNYFKVINLFVKNLKKDRDTPEYLIDLAGKLIEKEHYEEVLKLYNIILVAFPNCIKVESDRGSVYLLQGKILQATDIFKRVYTKDKNDLINLRNYIYASILAEDFKTAYNLLVELIGKDKEDYYSYFEAGLLAYSLDKDPIKFLTKFKDARKNDDIESTEKDFWYQNTLEFLKIDSKTKDEKLGFLEYLLEQFNNSEFDKLSIITANIIEKIEVTSYSLVIHASIFDKHKFFEKTVEYLDKIRERKKTDDSIMTDYDLNVNYGRTYFVAEKYEPAKEYFLKNFQEKKDDALVNHLLGMCYLELNQIDEAKKYFKINSKMYDKEQMIFINNSIRVLKTLEKE
jgi:tetratricopeptide (TPR) repeat protein